MAFDLHVLLSLPVLCGLGAPPDWARYEAVDLHEAPYAALVDEELGDHEALEGVVGVATSEHFAFKWGADWEPALGQSAEVLAALETAYTLQVEELGFTRPSGMTLARLNVYAANTGLTIAGEPLELNDQTAGVAEFDPAGWPMIVFAPHLWQIEADQVALGLLAEGEGIEVTLAHEFHHTCQLAAGAYPMFVENLWFIEGLAIWAQDRQVPESWITWGMVMALYLMPELAIEVSDVSAAPGLSDQVLYTHFYGTAALALFLSRDLERPDLVVTWSVDANGHAAPMERLAELLADVDESSGAVVTRMWAGLDAVPSGLARALPHVDHVPAELVDHNPTAPLEVGGGWQAPPHAQRPQRFGANVVRIDDPVDDLLVTLEGDARGSADTQVRWGVAAVVCTDPRPCEVALLHDGDGDPRDLPVAAAGADRVDLIIVPITDRYVSGESFTYRVRADVDEAAVGCTCAGGSTAGVLFALVTLAAVRRRRRSAS